MIASASAHAPTRAHTHTRIHLLCLLGRLLLLQIPPARSERAREMEIEVEEEYMPDHRQWLGADSPVYRMVDHTARVNQARGGFMHVL